MFSLIYLTDRKIASASSLSFTNGGVLCPQMCMPAGKTKIIPEDTIVKGSVTI
jgi:hypothetical protein